MSNLNFNEITSVIQNWLQNVSDVQALNIDEELVSKATNIIIYLHPKNEDEVFLQLCALNFLNAAIKTEKFRDILSYDLIKSNAAKLVEVISIEHCDPAKTTQRQTALIKVKASGTNRSVIIELCNIYRAHIIDVAENSLIIETTGSEDKIGSLIRMLEPYGILEMLKSGLVAMDRGEKVIR